MNKSELIDALAAHADLPKAAIARLVEGFVEIVSATLSKGEAVALVGFGTFDVSERKERVGHNPQTGEKITIRAAKVPRFRAGKQLKDQVNKK